MKIKKHLNGWNLLDTNEVPWPKKQNHANGSKTTASRYHTTRNFPKFETIIKRVKMFLYHFFQLFSLGVIMQLHVTH